MSKRNFTLLSFALCALACLGWGCGKPASAPSVQVTGPKPLAVAGLTPHELAQKINLTKGSVLVMQQTFTGEGVKAAAELKLGVTGSERDIVIRRFAPGHSAEVEWKNTYKDGAGKEQQYTGALLGIDLQKAHEFYLPALWKGDNQNALGLSGIWLSADTFEDLSRSKLGTLYFGMQNQTALDMVSTSTAFREAEQSLKSAVENALKNHTDVFLTKTDSALGEWPLKINGVETKVEVLKARSWFGEVTVLNNPQNPLVLKLKMNDLPAAKIFNGLYDYEITELRDLQE